MITEAHPVRFLSTLFKRSGATFTLSKYVYTPDSLMDEREVLSVAGDHLTEEWVDLMIASLRSDQELAFHSTVRLNGKTWHVPMIDFSLETGLSENIFDRMSRYLPKALMLSMAAFSSGRSFHAYSTTLLAPREWYDFMGRLLLINPRDGEAVVDTRWVGHRLIGGFGSLRWSNNSGQYAGLPSRVSFP